MTSGKQQRDESQEAIVNATEGLIVVDAGPGTGKTHTVINRCLKIIERKDIGAPDVMMLTFTRNAAQEMRDRLSSEIAARKADGTYDGGTARRLQTTADGMRIQTFDSYCLSVVQEAPGAVSRFFGFRDEHLTHNASIYENESVNIAFFGRVLERFLLEHGSEYPDTAPLLASKPDSVYRLLQKLMSFGIIPMRGNGEKEGIGRWFGEGNGKELLGHPEEVAANYKSLKTATVSLAKRMFPEAGGDKEALVNDALKEDRSELLRAIHDVYYEYIRRSIAEDRLTFGLAATLAFVILYSDPEARKRRCRYLIVDEFQDTNASQLMVCMMSLKEPNLCVVGDWKQGIYGFRFVSIDNIRDFEGRLKRFREFLDDGKHGRVAFDIDEVKTLSLKKSYRSAQAVIDAAYKTLTLSGSKTEQADTRGITRIEPVWDEKEMGSSSVRVVECDNRSEETEEVANRIADYVNGTEVYDKKLGKKRCARYGDIAVLCRTVSQCREVYRSLTKLGIPAFLQGDMEIMSSKEAKILLAWLRYVNDARDTWGIGAILAMAGYPASEIEKIIHPDDPEDRKEVPEEITRFRNELAGKRRRVTDLVASVFAYYGLENNMTQAITSVIARTHDDSLMTITEVIGMIEHDIENKTTYSVDGLPDSDSVTVQTMHKSKGLEYPIVIIPFVDTGSFPSTKSGSGDAFTFDEKLGVRCASCIEERNGYRLIERSWRTAALKDCLLPDYGEERRLFFVAVSRAMQHVAIIGARNGKGRCSPFLEGMLGENTVPALKRKPSPVKAEQAAEVPFPELGEIRPRRKVLGVHMIMGLGADAGSEGGTDEVPSSGRGMNYGTRVHRYAQMLADGVEVDPKIMEKYPELNRAEEIIRELVNRGMLLESEYECSLPLDSEGLNVTLRGVIDLLAVGKDGTAEIHDWKNDQGTDREESYRLQLSVYAQVVKALHPDWKVKCCLQWLYLKKTEEFEPLPMAKIAEETRRALAPMNGTSGASGEGTTERRNSRARFQIY